MGRFVKGLVVALAVLVSMTPAMASDFSMNATEYAAAFLMNTIGNLQLGAKVLDLLYAVNESDDSSNLFQNFWGLAYGGLLVAGWNNQVTATVIDELANTSNTNLTQQRKDLSEAIRYMANNTTVVFGDTAGNAGLSKLLKHQVLALQNKSIETLNSTGEMVPLVEAYADALITMVVKNIYFTVELLKAIPQALT
uniref:Uncharacterized protein n=1 Tax=Archaeoglobus fulgidus TaxID=2234 RepID=A0A7C3RLM5_ARCFL